jgi:hypothetical protein
MRIESGLEEMRVFTRTQEDTITAIMDDKYAMSLSAQTKEES